MVLSEVEETVTTVEVDEETCEEVIKVGTAAALIRPPRPRCSLASDLQPSPRFVCPPPQSSSREIPMIYVRGDGVILVAPPLRG